MTEGAPAAVPSTPELFAVECTTCKARLRVRSLAAIGQILACPKCHSMVMVTPPRDWHAPGEAPPLATEQPANEVAAASGGSAFWKIAALSTAAATICAAGVFVLWRQFPQREPRPYEMVAANNATIEQAAEPNHATGEVASSKQPEAMEAAPTSELIPTEVAEEPVPAADTTPPIASPDEEVHDSPLEHEVPPAESPMPEPTEAPEAAPPAEEAVPPAPEPASAADDLLRRLQTSVVAIDEPEISLAALAELLGGLSACRIELDEVSLAKLGVTGDTRTSVQLENGTIEAALTAALEPLELRFEARGKAIVIFAERE